VVDGLTGVGVIVAVRCSAALSRPRGLPGPADSAVTGFWPFVPITLAGSPGAAVGGAVAISMPSMGSPWSVTWRSDFSERSSSDSRLARYSYSVWSKAVPMWTPPVVCA
jgi:hypothetical protein